MSLNIFELAKKRLEEQTEKNLALDDKLDDEGPKLTEVRRRHESTLLICGTKNVGKSSLIMRFLDRNENPRPTIALEYTYARRTRGTNKDVSHVWELGGGAALASLLHVPINPRNIEVSSLVVMVDLTKPEELWISVEKLVGKAKEKIDAVLKEMKTTSPAAHDRLLAAAKARGCEKVSPTFNKANSSRTFNSSRPIRFQWLLSPASTTSFRQVIEENQTTRASIEPREILQNMESEPRRNIAKTLRFLAHYYGATLLMYSGRMENLVLRGRALLSHLAFHTANSKGLCTDFNKPLFVPAGGDSLEDIGAPPSADSTFGSRITHPLQLWKEGFCALYPQKEVKLEAAEESTAEKVQFQEPQIDKMIEQKKHDLEMYIKQKRDRNAAEERAAAKVSGN